MNFEKDSSACTFSTKKTNETCVESIDSKSSIISVRDTAHYIENPEFRTSTSQSFSSSILLSRQSKPILVICPSSRLSKTKKIYISALNDEEKDEVTLDMNLPRHFGIEDSDIDEQKLKKQLDSIIASETVEMSHLELERAKYDTLSDKFEIFESEFQSAKNWTSKKLEVVENGIKKVGSMIAWIPEIVYALLAIVIIMAIFKFYDVSKDSCHKKKTKKTLKEEQPLTRNEDAQV